MPRAVVTKSLRSLALAACSVCLVGPGLGCAAEVRERGDESSQLEPVSFGAMVQPLIDEACNCHQSSPILMAPFSLKPGEAYENLVNAPSGQLATMQLVSPGALNDSYLWHKLNGTQLEVGGSGDRMPSTIPLDATQLRVFEHWIASGAEP